MSEERLMKQCGGSSARSRKWLSLALLVLTFSNSYSGIWSFISVKGDSLEMSPGKVPRPQEHNLYLGTSEVQVKAEFSRAIVLQQTKGDLFFNVTITSGTRRTVAIYIPPEFGLNRDRRYVWSSVTNDYRFISLSTLSARDPIAPEWYRISVSNGTDRISSGSHYVRVFNVTAPSIVGQYFFKAYTDGVSIGANNFPTLVVSASIFPAYISGTVLDGGRDLSQYGHPIQLKESQGGKVFADGYTLDGTRVVAQAFFNQSANGRYTLYGLAPGTYSLTASAIGYCDTTRPELVSVLAGQSLTGIDILALPSPKIKGTVWSKCGGMSSPWGPVPIQVGPGPGAALAYVGTAVFSGHDFIYAFRGSDTSGFFRYDATVNAWEMKASPPSSVGCGGSLAFDGMDYIYALQGGGSNTFWRYDVANDEWTELMDTPSPVGDGGALVFNSNDGSIYALGGGGTSNLWRYDPPTDTWHFLESALSDVGPGGSLVFDTSNFIYAFTGNGAGAFWSYDPLTDTWTARTAIPQPVTSGASLAFNTQNSLIYALGGGGTSLYSYDSSSDSWSSLPNVPIAVGPGGSLIFDSDNKQLYALVGGGDVSVFSFSPGSPGVWKSAASFPLISPRPITIEILDSLGQSEYVLRGTTDPTSDRFDFWYDGTTGLDGHIPQDSSGYISGISGGLHIVRVWVNQYVQRDVIQLPGTANTIVGVQVQLPDHDAYAGIQLSVHRAGWAEVLVHFKHFPENKQASPPALESAKTVSVTLYDSYQVARGQNSTRVPVGSTSGLVILTGALGSQRDYGFPTDTYFVGVSVNGFYQPSYARVSIADCNARSQVSVEVFKTGSLNVTVYSINSQRPSTLKNWAYAREGASISMQVRDRYGVKTYASSSARQRADAQNVTFSVTGLRTGNYSIYVFTYGYVQLTRYFVFVTDGAWSDTAVYIVQGSTLDLTIILRKENILTPPDTYPFSQHRVPIRIEVFDAYNRFVAATAAYVSPMESTFSFSLAGFRNYAGSYCERRWVNYYDTTSGAIQRDYGLSTALHTFVVYMPGFSQRKTGITVMLPKDGAASVIINLDRLAHLSGRVDSVNMFDESVSLNWVTVDAVGEKTHDFTFTLDGYYDMWMEKGRYLVIWSLGGYEFAVKDMYLPEGSDVEVDVFLNPLLTR
jgi:hypothetical protein